MKPKRLPPIFLGFLFLTVATAAAASSGAAPADTVGLAAPDVAPELVRFVDAVYPPDALKAGLEGIVRLELLVAADGTVDSVRVLEGLGPSMNAAASAAAAGFLFTPARVAGEAVPVLVEFVYEFSLREQTRRIEEIVNFRGALKEKGTRTPVGEAMVVVSFPGPESETGLAVPRDVYLERIGEFPGQYLEEDRLVTFTDSTGHFELKSLPPGLVELTFPNPGYEELVTTEELAADEVLDATYWIARSAYNEYEIVVYGKAEQKEVTRQRLSVTEVERLPGFGGDVIKTVQALPGVARPSVTDAGAVVVRGSGNYDTRYFLDGIDIPLLFHFGGVKSTYNSLSLASVDLYPGGFGTRYGGAVGGIVELMGRPAKTDRWHTVLDASLIDASFHVEGPIGRDWSLMMSSRRSFVGEVVNQAVKNIDDLEMSVAPYYWDVVTRIDHQSERDGQLFLTLFAAKDRLSLVFPDEDEGSPEVNQATNAIDTSLRFSRFILGWDRPLGRRFRNELRAAAGDSKEGGHILGFFDWEVHGPYYQLRDELSMQAGEHLALSGGVDLLFAPIEYDVQSVGWPASVRSQDFSDLGAYANVELRPTRNLLLIPGVRYDYYSHLDDGAFSARLTSRYRVTGRHTLTGALGTYNQDPKPAGQATDPVYGNPDLPPTRAAHATLGDEWQIDDRTSVKVEGYYNRQWDIPSMTDSLGLNFVADTDGRMYGLELMLRKETGDRFFGWLSYSISRSERRYARRPSADDGFGESSTAGQAWDPDAWVLYDFDQTHHVEALGSMRWGGSWSSGLRLQYVSGNPATPYLGYTGNRYEFDADAGSYRPVSGEYLSDRMDPYFRTDLRVDKKFVRQSYLYSIYLDVQNVNYFVYNPPEGYTYNYDYSKRNEYGWIILPSLGVRVEF